MFYRVNPKMANALKQSRKKTATKKGDPKNKKCYFLVF